MIKNFLKIHGESCPVSEAAVWTSAVLWIVIWVSKIMGDIHAWYKDSTLLSYGSVSGQICTCTDRCQGARWLGDEDCQYCKGVLKWLLGTNNKIRRHQIRHCTSYYVFASILKATFAALISWGLLKECVQPISTSWLPIFPYKKVVLYENSAIIPRK